MSGSTHGERKLCRPAVNEINTPNETDSIHAPSSDAAAAPPAPPDGAHGESGQLTGHDSLRVRLLRFYFALKYRVFRRERRPADRRRGLIALQIDALAYEDLRRAMELGYCPTI